MPNAPSPPAPGRSPARSLHPPTPRLRGGWRCLLLLALPALLPAQSLEYRVKAAYLFNFAKFVEWPAAAMPTQAALRVGVWAPEETTRTILTELSGKQVGSRIVSATRFQQDEDLPHILFVHADSEPIPPSLMESLVENHVLVVGESRDFASRYGVIGLVLRGDSVRFQVNIAAAKRSGLSLNSQLARIAELVSDKS